jgi:hypothetical protein
VPEIYKPDFTVSYSAVFPTLLVAQAIPKDNAFVHGLVDGVRAALAAIGVGHEAIAGRNRSSDS